MNYEQANSVKELASPVNKVLEGLKVNVARDVIPCVGSLYAGRSLVGLDKKTHKISYTWTPQVGEWCTYLIGDLGLIHKVQGEQWVWLSDYGYELHKDSVTPILEWEEIERVLEKAGFRIDISAVSECIIIGDGSKYLANTEANSRQEAVMKAVIELGKESK